jgi:hypothetical protein
MRFFLLVALLLAAGCAAAPPAGQGEAAAVPQPPVIEKAWAPETVRDGTYWQAYLKVADPDCDLAGIYARVSQLGFGSYRIQQFNLGEGDRCGVAGRVSFFIGPDFLWGSRFEVALWVKDKAGNNSQRLTFPVLVDGPPTTPPPADLSGPEFQRPLGSITVRLRSPVFERGRPGLGGRLGR